MRTKSFKLNNKQVKGVLVAGGPGFKIYTVSGVNGWILNKARAYAVVLEGEPAHSIVSKYVNLRYQPIDQQEKIAQDFMKLIKEDHMKNPTYKLFRTMSDEDFKALLTKLRKKIGQINQELEDDYPIDRLLWDSKLKVAYLVDSYGGTPHYEIELPEEIIARKLASLLRLELEYKHGPSYRNPSKMTVDQIVDAYNDFAESMNEYDESEDSPHAEYASSFGYGEGDPSEIISNAQLEDETKRLLREFLKKHGKKEFFELLGALSVLDLGNIYVSP